MSRTIPQRDALWLQLAMIAGDEPAGGLLEVRYRMRDGRGMGQCWHPCDRPRSLAETIEGLGARTETYVGAAPRRDRRGGLDAIERCWTLWADCDTGAAIAALARFEPPAAVVIKTGTGEHRHAYWPLRRPLEPEQARRANRRLAHALGADMRATDAARILRPAGTFNHKTKPPRPVECVRLEIVSYTAEQVVGELADPPDVRSTDAAIPRSTDARAGRSHEPLRSDEPLRSIPAEVYVPLLTGRRVGRDGKVTCPFHGGGQERAPSLHVYPGDGGFFCYGCDRGGGIIELGALLYGIEPRGAGYHELRRRLAAGLLAGAAAA